MSRHNEEQCEAQPIVVTTETTLAPVAESSHISALSEAARANPRSVDKALKEALTLATLDEDTAASMFYSLPRGSKRIEGPSARLAEIIAYSWRNLMTESAIVEEDATHVTAVGTCFDLERIVGERATVKRRITDKHGVRYNADMIAVTSNAATSIASRNAKLKVIPRTFVDRIYKAARAASIGKAGTIAQKRQNALGWFAKAGIAEAQVFTILGVRGLDDIGQEELIALRGMRTALQEGQTTVEALLARDKSGSDGADELNAATEPTEAEHAAAEASLNVVTPGAAPDADGSRRG